MLAVGVWLRATNTVLHTCLLIHKTSLFGSQPQVGHLVGRHTEVAMEHRLVVLLRQPPAHRYDGIGFLQHVGYLREELQVVLLYGDILGFAIVLDPFHIRHVPRSGGLLRLLVCLDFRTRHEYARAFSILLGFCRFRLIGEGASQYVRLCLQGEACHRQEAQ